MLFYKLFLDNASPALSSWKFEIEHNMKTWLYTVVTCSLHIWLEFINMFSFFFPLPVIHLQKLQPLNLISNGQKLLDQLLKYGKILLLSVWLIVVICYVSISWECIAIILTETTQQQHRPLESVYCIMGVTGYLSPILRSLLVFPTRYDSFTAAGLRLGLFLTC